MVLRASLLVLVIGIIVVYSFHQDAFAAEQPSGGTTSSNGQTTDTQSGQLVGNEPQISGTRKVTIDTVPRVGNVVVDDMIYLSSELPLRFDWKVNSRHTIEISDTKIKNGDDSRYVFDMWNDQTKAVAKTVNVKSDMNLRAIFQEQNRLKINSDVGTVQGGGWYYEGDVAQFSISGKNIIQDGSEHRYIFDGWSDGDSKKSLENSITVENPTIINANWKEQYYLQLTSTVPGKSIPGSGWFDKGQKVSLVTDKEFESGSDTKYEFNRWVVTGDDAVLIDNTNSNMASLTINGPYTVMADWKKFYYVNVQSPYGTAQGSGFYEEGSRAEISLPINEFTILENKRKAVFDRWSGVDSINLANSGSAVPKLQGSLTQSLQNTQNNQLSNTQLSSPNMQVRVDKPMTLVAKWKDQYYLDVTTKQGSASGSGWYTAGQMATLEITPPSAPPGVWIRYIFDGWTDSSQQKFQNGKVIMNEPKTIKAVWKEDYSPAVINSLIMVGVGAGGLFVYKKTKKMGIGMMLANKIPMRMSNERETEVTDADYDLWRKRTPSPRARINPTEYQYALFEPRARAPQIF